MRVCVCVCVNVDRHVRQWFGGDDVTAIAPSRRVTKHAVIFLHSFLLLLGV